MPSWGGFFIKGGVMENLIVVFAMRLLAIKARDSRLINLIAFSCVVFELTFYANIDIALYYIINALFATFTAYVAYKYIATLSAKVFSVFMLIQSALCLPLIFNWTYSINEALENAMTEYNVILIAALITLGVISNANKSTR